MATLLEKFEEGGFLKRKLIDICFHDDLVVECSEKIEHYRYLLHDFSSDFKEMVVPSVTLNWCKNLENWMDKYRQLTSNDYNYRDIQKYIKTDKIQKGDKQ